MSADPVQCPVCGWTGTKTDLDTKAVPSCPVCDQDIEVVV